MQSIKGRITAIVLLAALVLLTVVAALLDSAINLELRSEFDRQLSVRAEGLILLADYEESGEVEFDFDADTMPSFRADHDFPEYFILSTLSGERIATSDSVNDSDMQMLLLPGTPPENLAPLRSITLSDGRQVCAISVIFTPPLDNDPDESDIEDRDVEIIGQNSPTLPDASLAQVPRLHLIVARGTEEFTRLQTRFRYILLVGLLVLLVALIAMVWFGVARGLKPLRALVSEVSALNEDRLDQRVSQPAGASELAPVSRQLNTLLHRLEDAFHRERSFSGNVAHELRTPIAELRSYAEIGSKWPQDTALAEKFFGELVDLSGDMERTVLNLLMLSRLDAGSIEVEMSEVNVAELVNRVWSRLSPQARECDTVLDLRIPNRLFVKTDPGKLNLILTNLIANAIAHGIIGSPVVVESDVREGSISLHISNQTDQLESRDLNRMFDRFWRKDEARSTRRHAGLGLSIVKSLADVLELRVKPELAASRLFRISLNGLVMR